MASCDEYGVWTLVLPDGPGGEAAIPHGSKIKAIVTAASGEELDRIPAWISRADQVSTPPVSAMRPRACACALQAPSFSNQTSAGPLSGRLRSDFFFFFFFFLPWRMA